MFAYIRRNPVIAVSAVLSAAAIAVLIWQLWKMPLPGTGKTVAVPGANAPAQTQKGATSSPPPDSPAAAPNSTASAVQPPSGQRSSTADSPAKTASSAPSSAPGQKANGAASPTPEAPAPAFDIVRVEPSGETVVAGRAQPGAKVSLLVSGKPAGSAQADANGQFVIIPDSLKPGSHDLTLREENASGGQVSRQNVAVSVPAKGSTDLVVALTEPGKATRVLSTGKPQQPAPQVANASPQAESAPAQAAPSSSQPAETSGPKTTPATPATPAPQQQAALKPEAEAPSVSIGAVEVEQGGGFYASGKAAPGTRLRLYMNDAHLADVVANSGGEWSMRVARGMTAGKYAIRIDAIDPATGKVSARSEVPFDYPAQAAAATPETKPAPPQASAATPAASPPAPSTPVQPAATTPASPTATPEMAASPPQAQTQAQTQAPSTPAKSPAAPAAGAPARSTPVQSAPVQSAPVQTPAATAGSQSPAPVSASPQTAAPGEADPGSPSHVTIERVATASVVRGDSLWRISRKMLGRGIRYTQIYEANTAQIRNPALIYPGQVLVVPMDKVTP